MNTARRAAQTTKLNRIIALALATTALSPAVLAQDKPIEEIVVTGTNVKGSETVPTANVQVMERVQIEQSGASQIADLVKSIPANTGTAQYNESGQLSGTAQFSLRGLGFSSTLTLLNGRRAGVSPLSDKSGADFVDINQFPIAMIQRIDILKDGASAIYGSEAVAGVVNLVTRKGFEGFEVSGDYSNATNESWNINLATGVRSDRGTINFYATYYRQTGNVRSDFDWLIERVGGDGVVGKSQLINTTSYPGNYMRATFNAAGQAQVVSGAVNVPDPNCEAAGGVFAINAAGVVNRSVCNYNFADQVGVVPAERRIQAFAEADYELTDNLKYFNETSFSRNLNLVFQHPGSYSNGAAVGGLLYIPASHPFNFFVADPNNAANIIAIAPSQWNNAIHTAVPIVGRFRPEGDYVRDDKRQRNTYMRTVNGLTLDIFDTWSATASHQFAAATFEENNPLGMNASEINAMLASGQYNPFATSRLSPTLISPKNGTSVARNSDAILDRVFYTSAEDRRTEQHVVDLSASGGLFDLPTGTVSIALGGQYRHQSLKFVPDSLQLQGLGSSPTRSVPFEGTQRVYAGYAEAIVPFNDLAQLQAAIRHEDYGGGIGSTTDPKFTARVNAIDDLLTLRGSWGTSFQAPTLTQGATTVLIQILNNPVVRTSSGLICATTTPTAGGVDVINTGGNLSPQNSENFNLGFDLTPTSDLSFNVDFWKYDYSNLIAAGQNAQSILTGQCVNGVYRADQRVVYDQGNVQVRTSFVNVGKVVTQGFDLSAAYNVPLDDLGDLSLRADATYIDKFDITQANGSILKAAGSRNFNTNFAPIPRWRGTARGVWTLGMHDLALGVNYTDSYRNDQSNNGKVPNYTTVDVQYTLRLEGLTGEESDTSFSVGMNNAFDKDPPALGRNNASGVPFVGTLADFDRPGYDPLGGANIQGRFIYAKFKQSF